MEERKEALQHRIVWTDRKRGNITGVTDVGSFDETTVILETDQGILTLKGKGLHIGKLSLEQGEVELDGVIALGAGLSFFYDFLRVLRRMIRHGAVATGIEDLLFWLFGACLLFALMFYGTDGELRGYVLLGTLCGALLYLQTAGPLLIRGGTAMTNYIRRKRKKCFFILKSNRKKGTIKKKP